MDLNYFNGLVIDGTRVRVEEANIGDGIRLPALVRDSGRSSRGLPLVVDLSDAGLRSRALSQFQQVTGGVDHLTTALVVGRLSSREEWVNYVAPPIVPTENGAPIKGDTFKWIRFNEEHLEERETLLPPLAPYRFGDFSYTEETASLAFHGYGTFADNRALARGENLLRYAARKADFPMRVLSMAMQFELRDVMTDTANSYDAAHVVTLAGGSEWDAASGNPRLDVQTGITTILDAIGGDPQDIKAAMSLATMNALSNSVVFREEFKHTVTPTLTTEALIAAMRDYLGVGELRLVNAHGRVSGATGPIFVDDFFMWSNGPTTENWDDTYGYERWMARFALNDGVVEQPWVDRLHRATLWAANREYAFKVVNDKAAYLIRNTAA